MSAEQAKRTMRYMDSARWDDVIILNFGTEQDPREHVFSIPFGDAVDLALDLHGHITSAEFAREDLSHEAVLARAAAYCLECGCGGERHTCARGDECRTCQRP